jgi:hypothetical protein
MDFAGYVKRTKIKIYRNGRLRCEYEGRSARLQRSGADFEPVRAGIFIRGGGVGNGGGNGNGNGGIVGSAMARNGIDKRQQTTFIGNQIG